jgi:exonuclease SbcC
LVVDEGFGSRQPSDRQRLVKAINSIQTDFEKELIFSHIDEMRDAFPTWISEEGCEWISDQDSATKGA